MNGTSLSLILCVAVTGFSQEARVTPLQGDEASIEYRGEGESDAFKPGGVLFTNRNYTIAECPKWLEGKRFLRGNIDFSNFRVTSPGILTLLTPEPVHPRASTQYKTLESRGFVAIAQPERFQLFGKQPFDLVRIYQSMSSPENDFDWESGLSPSVSRTQRRGHRSTLPGQTIRASVCTTGLCSLKSGHLRRSIPGTRHQCLFLT